jgi:LAO/AO transport system kinase
MLELSQGIASGQVWRPPIVSTVALRDEGVDELWQAIGRHRVHLLDTGLLEERRFARITDELRHIVAARLLEQAGARTDDPRFERLRDKVVAREIDPWGAAGELLGLA